MNHKLLFEHLFVHNFFRCKEQIIKLQNYKKKQGKRFCSLCFEVECRHNVEKDRYVDAIEQLKIWRDLNLTYGKGRFLVSQEGIPTFPSLGFDINTKYIAKPVLDLPFCAISVKVNGGEKLAYFNNGKINEELTNYAYDKKFGEGIWYGYFDKRFYLLSLFKNGKFTNLTRYNLPYKKVSGLEKVNFEMKHKSVWYLPEVQYYHEYHRYLHKL